jgi:hypothetical protein
LQPGEQVAYESKSGDTFLAKIPEQDSLIASFIIADDPVVCVS